jgi:hypothetical protein
VLGFIINVLSPKIAAHVLGFQSAISTHSQTRIHHLRGALNNTKNDLTTAQLFGKMKGFAFELAADKTIEDDEMIDLHPQNGLESS